MVAFQFHTGLIADMIDPSPTWHARHRYHVTPYHVNDVDVPLVGVYVLLQFLLAWYSLRIQQFLAS